MGARERTGKLVATAVNPGAFTDVLTEWPTVEQIADENWDEGARWVFVHARGVFPGSFQADGRFVDEYQTVWSPQTLGRRECFLKCP